jgi:hypothetical protein
LKVCIPLQLFVYLDRKSPAIPYWPYCQPVTSPSNLSPLKSRQIYSSLHGLVKGKQALLTIFLLGVRPCPNPAFGTFAKPNKATHNQSFAKEPNFASFSFCWRFFDFQIKPEFPIFGKNWFQYV